MRIETTDRRRLLQSLAALPAAALVLRPQLAVAAATKIITFNGNSFVAGGKVEVRTFGWAAETADGWTGIAVDAGIANAMRDMVGTATGMTAVVPKGMSGTINGHMNKDGVRGTSVCFEEVTGANISGTKVVIEGKLIAAENPMIFKHGDPMRVEGDASTGEYTYTLRGGGKDNKFDMKGVILIA
jgi:hypothetical protein